MCSLRRSLPTPLTSRAPGEKVPAVSWIGLGVKDGWAEGFSSLRFPEGNAVGSAATGSELSPSMAEQGRRERHAGLRRGGCCGHRERLSWNRRSLRDRAGSHREHLSSQSTGRTKPSPETPSPNCCMDKSPAFNLPSKTKKGPSSQYLFSGG